MLYFALGFAYEVLQDQSGYGLVDVRAITQGGVSPWACNNPNGIIESTNVFPNGIQALQGSEQSGYGIVDLRVWA